MGDDVDRRFRAAAVQVAPFSWTVKPQSKSWRAGSFQPAELINVRDALSALAVYL